MNKNEILEILNDFENTSLTKFEFENSEFRLALEKNRASSMTDSSISDSPIVCRSNQNEFDKNIENEVAVSYDAAVVKSPIVGVFYAAPSPEDEPYVMEGDQVEEGQVLCLVEAMKMMNELKSPVNGIVRKINGVNGEMVEFDQVLFEVEPC